ncbi:disintegrin and metalloproteinase domain-containing protein 20-like [Tamandua tetradactyla]|uniref:disintegrin and metalloproteinase domain-containing protein 20-like n=1 Tax=Tamandua tetradactyla TaxID=48850 RepID=UPI0040538EAA
MLICFASTTGPVRGASEGVKLKGRPYHRIHFCCCADALTLAEDRTLQVCAAVTAKREERDQQCLLPPLFYPHKSLSRGVSLMAGGEVLLQVRFTLLLLWLEVFLVLTGWSKDEPSQHHSPPEVVIPLKITGTGKRIKASGWLSYRLHFGGQRHIVHMKVKKLFLARNLPVFTYTDQGALLEDHPYVQNDCYYHGYVEGDPESLVVLSSCLGGFLGMLQINDTIYEIKPKMFSKTFEHLVYKLDSEEAQFPMRCGLTEEEIARQLTFHRSNDTLMQSAYEGWWTHLLTIELAIVVDKNRYVSLDSNETNVQREVFNLVNLVNSFYAAMEVNLALYGIEIWTEENFVSDENINTFLSEFCKWKHGNLGHRVHHDIAHVIADKHFGIYLGLAYVGTVCVSSYNCAVLRFSGNKMSDFGVITAHELGHNLGMPHDENYCVCAQSRCIMFPAKVDSSKFSNCSYASFWNTVIKKTCLRNTPNLENILKEKRCGNSVVEEGEECDCGSFKSCNRNPCCLLNCQLRPGAACAFGACCENCQFTSAGKLCRAEVNECDLPEWCNGSSSQCPEDVYLQDGTPCQNGSYCFEKRCNNRDGQCRKIFGEDAKNANLRCYTTMNTRGDRFGHCGISGNKYVKCKLPNVLCGRVQCENITVLPLLQQHSTVHRIHLNNVTCWGTDYHFGMTIPDMGDVKDGTECGPDKICIHRECVPMDVLKRVCTNLTCNMKGVCNNKEHCHCISGWSPPRCKFIGHGGSVDSGPPSGKKKRGKNKSGRQPQKHPTVFVDSLVGFTFMLFDISFQEKEKETI